MPNIKPKAHHDRSLRCGSCKWLVTQFRGRTCPEKYNVVPESKACIEYEYQPQPVKWDKLRLEDKFLLDVFTELKGSRYTLDNTMSKELSQYFVASRIDKEGNEQRRIPTGFMGKKDLFDLASLFEETQAFKDRTRKIYVACLKRKRTVLRLKKTCEAYIFKNWGDDLAKYKNEGARSTIVDDVLAPLTDYLMRVDLLLEKADTVLDNLRDTHFTLNSIKEIALELIRMTGENNGKERDV